MFYLTQKSLFWKWNINSLLRIILGSLLHSIKLFSLYTECRANIFSTNSGSVSLLNELKLFAELNVFILLFWAFRWVTILKSIPPQTIRLTGGLDLESTTSTPSTLRERERTQMSPPPSPSALLMFAMVRNSSRLIFLSPLCNEITSIESSRGPRPGQCCVLCVRGTYRVQGLEYSLRLIRI